MIIVLKSGSTDARGRRTSAAHPAPWATRPHTIRGELRTVIGAVGDDRGKERLRALESLECVESGHADPAAVQARQPRGAQRVDTQVRVGDVVDREARSSSSWPGRARWSRASRCWRWRRKVKAAGRHVLRGGAFKPRTSPYAFQGLEEEGLKLLAEARRETGLPVITEVMEPDKVDVVAEHADILQIGARNMQNFSLLRRVGEAGKPVLLKRGMSTSIQEWLLSAEYVLAGGNPERHPVRARHPHLRDRPRASRSTSTRCRCSSSSRTCRSSSTRATAPGTGSTSRPMALAAVAAGADGLIIEVHPRRTRRCPTARSRSSRTGSRS